MEEREEVAWDIPLEDEELEYEEEEYEEEPEDLPEEPDDVDEWPSDLIIIRKESFIKLFGHLLEPEQIAELRGGYYDGDRMTVWLPDGTIEVGVEHGHVVITNRDYDRLWEYRRGRRDA